MAVSIRDVANHAGVSIATASRVLNNTDYPVSDAVRHQVLKSAQELEYVPNHSARNLRKREGNGLALIVRNIGDPYYLPIVRGVTETALKYDSLAMVFNSMQDTLLGKRFYQRLQEWQLSGVLIGGGGYRTSEHDSVRRMICALQSMGLKTIALAPQDMKMPMVAIDNFNAGRESTYYLIRHNHRRIAFIGGYVNHISDEERLMGYRVVLESMGIPYDPKYVARKEFSWQGGYDCCMQLLKSGAKFTAICCSNDHLAYGALCCLNDMGLRVPQDMSLTGMGNFPVGHEYGIGAQSDETKLELTTVGFPLYELGRRAVELLLGQEELPQTRILLPVEVIERNSVAKI